METGEVASLGAAVLWAVASLLYGATTLNAWTINFAKNIFASLVLAVHLFLVSLATGESLFQGGVNAWSWLGISGLIGIVLGDTFYFRSLQILGARRALVVTLSSPVMALLLGWCILGESHALLALAGVGVTVAGVIFVVTERKNDNESPGLFPGSTRQGIVFGSLGAVCQATGGVASKMGMVDCDPLEAAFIRLFVSAIIIAVGMTCGRRIVAASKGVLQLSVLKRLIPASMLGTYLGIWLAQIGYKETSVAVATTLMCTSPLFAIPLVIVFLKQRVSKRALIGTVVTILGVFLLTSY
jgi:drug/metabolite transporter (DMT)-like permease